MDCVSLVCIEDKIAVRARIFERVWEMFRLNVTSQVSIVIRFEVRTYSTIFGAMLIYSHVLVEVLYALERSWQRAHH